jgi:outer membrane protein assembly factor BamD (BamD/ComL family)
MRIVLPLSATAFLASVSVASAQERDASNDNYARDNGACSREFFDAAEARFAKRAFSSQTLAVAEQQLRKITVNCADVPWLAQAKEHLRTAQEERASTSLSIGLFYLERYRLGTSGTIEGARSRLAMIVEQYPEFSKLDQVLVRLGDASVVAGRLDEAVACYRRVVKEFPGSQYFGEAALQLNILEGQHHVPF